MKIRALIDGLPIRVVGSDEVEVLGISSYAQEVSPGDLFLARAGLKTSGAQFIQEALKRGAVAVSCCHDTPLLAGPTYLLTDNPGDIEAALAARFYHYPSQELSVIGVTGTNGKTTTTWLIQQLLALYHHRPVCGLVGTLGYDSGPHRHVATHTTPNPFKLQRLLREMVDTGYRYAAIEVSSHALMQRRVNEIAFQVVVFTNLSRDHLDYHGTMEAYLAAKARLFAPLPLARGEQCAREGVVCGDDPSHVNILTAFQGNIMRYGTIPGCDLQLVDDGGGYEGAPLHIAYQGKDYRGYYPLIGTHNAMNLLAAMGALLVQGYPLEPLLSCAQGVEAPKGRLQRLSTPYGRVYLDYAHTPDALERVLRVLRRCHPRGRLLCVFGCGGERDVGKRPLMGKVAQQESDLVVVTSDNPRGESPEAIIEEIVCELSPRPPSWVDRGHAIAYALEQLQDDDVLLIAGKGHETYQIIGSRALPFDDSLVVATWFANHG